MDNFREEENRYDSDIDFNADGFSAKQDLLRQKEQELQFKFQELEQKRIEAQEEIESLRLSLNNKRQEIEKQSKDLIRIKEELNQRQLDLDDKASGLKQEKENLKVQKKSLEEALENLKEKGKAKKVELIFNKSTALASKTYTAAIECKAKSLEEVFNTNKLRPSLDLPDLGELDVVRHFSQLARLNFSVDNNFYPLGSCTMKYNPKINEYLASLKGFRDIHPLQETGDIQGALELMYNLDILLSKITGMKKFTLQPNSGAHGELTGMLMIKKYHQVNDNKKTTVIVPDSAHGTNPATVSMAGYKTLVVESDKRGLINLEQLKALVDDQTAAIMLTNPNTLGLFEENILTIQELAHKNGALLYYDGANLNPLLGITNPGLMGFDLVHLNLHKTFSTPHGCGGPGAGVVGVNEKLIDFLPTPIITTKDNKFEFEYNLKHSIGRIRSFYGNFTVLVRAYAYILRLGIEGLVRVSQMSVLNANYIKKNLESIYKVPYPQNCMHEVVFSCGEQKERGALALDIAKALIDQGIHPPTMYFPLIVKEALMVEPTETESKKTLDNFIEAMKKIDRDITDNLEKIKQAPVTAPVRRVDEVKAARFPDLNFFNTKGK